MVEVINILLLEYHKELTVSFSIHVGRVVTHKSSRVQSSFELKTLHDQKLQKRTHTLLDFPWDNEKLIFSKYVLLFIKSRKVSGRCSKPHKGGAPQPPPKALSIGPIIWRLALSN